MHTPFFFATQLTLASIKVIAIRFLTLLLHLGTFCLLVKSMPVAEWVLILWVYASYALAAFVDLGIGGVRFRNALIHSEKKSECFWNHIITLFSFYLVGGGILFCFTKSDLPLSPLLWAICLLCMVIKFAIQQVGEAFIALEQAEKKMWMHFFEQCSFFLLLFSPSSLPMRLIVLTFGQLIVCFWFFISCIKVNNWYVKRIRFVSCSFTYWISTLYQGLFLHIWPFLWPFVFGVEKAGAFLFTYKLFTPAIGCMLVSLSTLCTKIAKREVGYMQLFALFTLFLFLGCWGYVGIWPLFYKYGALPFPLDLGVLFFGFSLALLLFTMYVGDALGHIQGNLVIGSLYSVGALCIFLYGSSSFFHTMLLAFCCSGIGLSYLHAKEKEKSAALEARGHR